MSSPQTSPTVRWSRRGALGAGLGVTVGGWPALGRAAAPALSGVFEACIGVDAADAESEEQYWARFGFERDKTGSLGKSDALILYGVGVGVMGVRLRHRGGAGRGHVRLMIWETLTGQGAGRAPLLSPGGRWLRSETDDIARIWTHAEAAAAQADAADVTAPRFSGDQEAARPWLDPMPGVRRMRVLEQTRRRIFESPIDVPARGVIDAQSALRGSEITGAGLVIAGDSPDAFAFYANTLALPVLREASRVEYDALDPATRELDGLAPGDAYWHVRFGDPGGGGEAGALDLRAVALGRWPAVRARFGDLGLSAVTYAARDLPAWRARIASSPAKRVTPVLRNELGEPAFCFDAPDGAVWQFVRA